MKSHLPPSPTQGVYRPLLTAMSRPGRPQTLPVSGWESPLLAVCETLLDHEVSFCVLGGDADSERRAEASAEKIFALTKAERVALAEADYLVVLGRRSGELARQAKTGTLEFPDRGATVIYVTEPGEPQDAGPLLSGPGLQREARPELNPLAREEWELLREVNAEYPLGVDAICLCGDRVVCFPRSTRIRMA